MFRDGLAIGLSSRLVPAWLDISATEYSVHPFGHWKLETRDSKILHKIGVMGVSEIGL